MKAPQIKKFMRVRQSESLDSLEPRKILSKIRNNQYFLLDFGDEKNIRIIQNSEPNQSDEETHLIGNNHIAGLNNLSVNTYTMLQYLSQKRATNQHKNSIDESIGVKIRNIQSQRKKQDERKRKRRRYDENLEKPAIFPENPNQLQAYLEETQNKLTLQKLKYGENELQKSLSSAGCYKKSNVNRSIQVKKDQINTLFKLPQIKTKPSRIRRRNF